LLFSPHVAPGGCRAVIVCVRESESARERKEESARRGGGERKRERDIGKRKEGESVCVSVYIYL